MQPNNTPTTPPPIDPNEWAQAALRYLLVNALLRIASLYEEAAQERAGR